MDLYYVNYVTERAVQDFQALSFPEVEPFPIETSDEWDGDAPGPRLLQNPDEWPQASDKRQRFTHRRPAEEEGSGLAGTSTAIQTPTIPEVVKLSPSTPPLKINEVEPPRSPIANTGEGSLPERTTVTIKARTTGEVEEGSPCPHHRERREPLLHRMTNPNRETATVGTLRPLRHGKR